MAQSSGPVTAAGEQNLVSMASRLARLGGWEIDLTTSEVLWSDEVSAIHGAPPGIIRSVDETGRYRDPRYADLVQRCLDACSSAGIPFDIESEAIAEDGHHIPVRITGEAVRDAYGNVVAIRGAFQDLTQWRQAEASLAQRQAQLRLLESAVARLNDIVVIAEAASADQPVPRIVYVNDSFVRNTGYTREEALGRSPRFLQGIETNREELDRLEDAMRLGQAIKVELLSSRKDGSEFWLELDLSPIRDESGQVTSFVEVQRNITERRNLADDLAKTDERFRAIFRASALAVWDWNVTDQSVWWMEAGPHSGATTEESSRLGGPLAGRIHHEDMPRVQQSIIAFLDGRDDTWTADYRFQTEANTYVPVVNRGFAVRTAEGTIVRMLGVVADVTESRILEEKLRRAQRLEAVGQLTGGVAHDFNNLLTVILGNTEMLFDSLAHDPDLGYLASITHSAAQRGAQLTKRLIAFARQQPLEPRAFDSNASLAGMNGLMRRSLMENIELTIKPADNLWSAFADPGELENALLNLVINARDAMPDGGKLLIETRNEVLDEAYAAANEEVAPGDYVLIAVSDTGTGMTPDVLARAFEPFFTTKPFGQGSGLGLSMIYGYAKQSKGHIRIYSEVGQGTTVKLYLPAATEAEKQDAQRERPATVAGGHEKILVVEDDPMVQDFACRQLQDLGYRPVRAGTAAEALAILNSQSDIDLLFTDVVMPGGMNGRQLADAASKIRPGLPVLFSSGYTENAIIHAGRLDQGVMLLSKPYSRAQLAQKIRQTLDRQGSFSV